VENGRADQRTSFRAKLCVAGGGTGEPRFYSEGERLSVHGDARPVGAITGKVYRTSRRFAGAERAARADERGTVAREAAANRS
jgi:hypothetical protein